MLDCDLESVTDGQKFKDEGRRVHRDAMNFKKEISFQRFRRFRRGTRRTKVGQTDTLSYRDAMNFKKEISFRRFRRSRTKGFEGTKLSERRTRFCALLPAKWFDCF